MLRSFLLAALLVPAVLLAPSTARAQDWQPPTREMPLMPPVADLEGDWLAGRTGWFSGVDRLSGVSLPDIRAAGESRPGSDLARVVRFSRGPLPVVVWMDRNGDDHADVVEIYRGGGVIIQVVDADYDGSANVMRVYDASGTLVREQAM